MKYDAVIFDLFGTLVDNFSIGEFETMLAGMADSAWAPTEGFTRV
ncbi:MAG: hypothetical protein QGH20_01605 [Candidatus Latescibacteria bacterium]|jgi:FMN phosphatase YigB (HAD superfamily)|nr:hypothetical protein [Candidatus Latescibacterota bacterium]